jgi:subtilisin-like proprotein convertase family protein
MNGHRLRRIALAFMTVGLVGCMALAAPTAQARKKLVQKTFTKGVGSPSGGTALFIPDGAGQAAQLVRSPINVKGLNKRGKIKDVNVGVRAGHQFAKDLEFYLASPRGVISLSHDVGGQGNNYGGSFASCAGQFTLFDSDTPTRIDTPGLTAPFAGTFAPMESLNLLNGLGDKKATNATWSLLVEDDDPSNPSGVLFCWKLTLVTTNPKTKR